MPPPASCNEFETQIRSRDALQLARDFILADVVHAFDSAEPYQLFCNKVRQYFPSAENIAIVGSGNWRYSLNPRKFLSEYHSRSDIDLAVVSSSLYHETWETIRALHRDRWYTLDSASRDRLCRNGQNIYSGFASPSWLPIRGHSFAYDFKSLLSKLSGPEIGYREVTMFYFKNEVEMLDYYTRGFMRARMELGQ